MVFITCEVSHDFHERQRTQLIYKLWGAHLASIVSFQLFKVGVEGGSWELRSPARFNLIRCEGGFFYLYIIKCFNKGAGQVSWKWKKNKYLAILILCEPTFIPGCSQNNGTEPRIWTKLEQEASKDTWFRSVSYFLQLFVLPLLTSCSVSTKLATWPSSFTPRTSNLAENNYQERNSKVDTGLIIMVILNNLDNFFTVFLPVHCSTEILLLPWPRISGMAIFPKKCLMLTCLAPTYTVRISTLPNITFKVLMTGFTYLG